MSPSGPASRQEQSNAGRASGSRAEGPPDAKPPITDHRPPITDPGPRITDPLEDLAHEFTQDSPNVSLKAAINIASMEFFTVLNRFDTDALIKRLEEKPQLYFQMMNSYANLMAASLEQQKLEFRQKQAEAKQREREQKLRSCKPILITATTISSIHSSVVRAVPRAPSSTVAAPRESVETSEVSSHVVTASAGPVSQLNESAADTELAQIVAAEFAVSDDPSSASHEQTDSWEDEDREDKPEEALIGCLA